MLPQTGKVTGTGVTFVLPADENRRYTLIINQLETEAYLAVGTNAVLGQGILLTTKGSHYEFNRDNYCAAQINAIGTNTLLNLTYQYW